MCKKIIMSAAKTAKEMNAEIEKINVYGSGASLFSTSIINTGSNITFPTLIPTNVNIEESLVNVGHSAKNLVIFASISQNLISVGQVFDSIIKVTEQDQQQNTIKFHICPGVKVTIESFMGGFTGELTNVIFTNITGQQKVIDTKEFQPPFTIDDTLQIMMLEKPLEQNVGQQNIANIEELPFVVFDYDLQTPLLGQED